MSDPVLTERVKLAASALNALATAALTVGVLAPSAAILYGVSTPTAPAWELALGAAIWGSFAGALHRGSATSRERYIAGALHRGAPRVLGRLPS